MSQIAISITMRTAFRDSTQEFSNTFHYGNIGTLPTSDQANALIDELVVAMKAFHSTGVTFVQGKCWSSGGTPAENHMISEKLLTGTGSCSTVAGFDKERAFLIQWDAGFDTRGHKVRLKKWFHSCGAFGTFSPASGILDNSTGMTTAQRDAIVALADAVTRIGPLEEWGLVAESGRQRDGGAPTAHKYLEHHQLGDQWRG